MSITYTCPYMEKYTSGETTFISIKGAVNKIPPLHFLWDVK